MALGKTITMYLVDGVPDGRICTYLSNWNGQCIKIPRNMLGESKDRSEANNSGIYFLFGNSEQDDELPQVYVGEAENVYIRLGQHIKGKEFWTDAVVFSSKDDNLTKAHIRYLEYRLLQLMKRNANYQLINLNDGNKTKLPEFAQADMEAYLDNVKIVLPALGYNVFATTPKDKKQKTKEFSLSVKGISAKGFLSKKGFVVLKGSVVSKTVTNSMSAGYRKKRDHLLANGIIVERNGELVFTEDVEFRSPTEAGVIVTGRSTSGRQSWRNVQGKTIKEIEEEIE